MARLVFRRLTGKGSDFPPWVRALRGKSGAYVIREWCNVFGLGPTLYVGMSKTGRLYGTLTRHFQAWHGKTASHVYDRNAVAVAVVVTPPEKASDTEGQLIDDWHPRDNEYKTGASGEAASFVPF